MRKSYWKKTSAVMAAFVCLGGTSMSVAQEAATLDYLKSLSIEDLLQTEITSVSKKKESLFSAAAAVTVISQEDIGRSGAANIPEALRMVPGLSVASIDGSRYAIGSRGFSELFETKLQLFIDGRSMYNPLYAGVQWNAIDLVMQDIERIEVIRGPGATVWGANAVNGVINIITKNSEDTQGGLVSVMGGNIEQPNAAARFGGEISPDTYYRVYAKGYNRQEYDGIGREANDGSKSGRSGFRVDSDKGDDKFSVQGEVYSVTAEAGTVWRKSSGQYIFLEGDEKNKGGHILGSWSHEFSGTSEVTGQFYYNRYENNREFIADETRDTIDLEIKHHWTSVAAHDIVWGVGYRWTSDDIEGTELLSFDPASQDDSLWSAFVQDDIELVDDFLWFTIGSKFEHNNYTGFEVQPSARLRIKPTEHQVIWTAVSRAVRSPARSEEGLVVNNVSKSGESTRIERLMGSSSFESETLIAYELGYRIQVTEDLSFDLATFYNDYEDLRVIEARTPYSAVYPADTTVYPSEITNGGEGRSYGFELQSSWQPCDKVKLIASYSYIDLELSYKNGSSKSGGRLLSSRYTPKHQAQLRTYWDIFDDLSLDSELYFVDDLVEGAVDAYFRFDLQLSWQATDDLRLSISGENLFDSGHQEFVDNQSNVAASEIPRQYWLKATYRF